MQRCLPALREEPWPLLTRVAAAVAAGPSTTLRTLRTRCALDIGPFQRPLSLDNALLTGRDRAALRRVPQEVEETTVPIEKLQTMGISATDVKKLREEGIVTVGLVVNSNKKARRERRDLS